MRILLIIAALGPIAASSGGAFYMYQQNSELKIKTAELDQQVSSMNQENSRLQKQITDTSQQINSLQAEYKQLQQQVTDVTQKNASLLEENTQLQKKNAELSHQAGDLQLQQARQNCEGRWENNSCIPFTTAFSVTPSSGSSPLNVTFTVKVPNMHYSIDYGDGSFSWLNHGASAESAGNCIPDKSGLCKISIDHTYRSGINTSFNAKLMKDGAVNATVSVKVGGGK